jgi:hypothetical protein
MLDGQAPGEDSQEDSMEEGSDEGDSEDEDEEEEEGSETLAAPELEPLDMDDIKDDYLDEEALLDTNIVIECQAHICNRRERGRKLLQTS